MFFLCRLNPLELVMADRLNFEERKFILKCYWKYENTVEVQIQLRREFLFRRCSDWSRLFELIATVYHAKY